MGESLLAHMFLHSCPSCGSKSETSRGPVMCVGSRLKLQPLEVLGIHLRRYVYPLDWLYWVDWVIV